MLKTTKYSAQCVVLLVDGEDEHFNAKNYTIHILPSVWYSLLMVKMNISMLKTTQYSTQCVVLLVDGEDGCVGDLSVLLLRYLLLVK